MPADPLVVQRHQEHRAEDRHPGQEQQDRRRGERAVGEQPHVDQRGAPGAQRVHGERGQQHRSHRGGRGVPVGQSEEDGRETGGEQGEPAHVEALSGVRLLGGDPPPREHQRDQAQRYVDPEDPPPLRGVDDHPADQGPEDGRELAGDRHDPHHPAESAGPGRADQDRLAQRQDHAAADALEHAERDQAAHVPRGTAQHGADQEHRQREQPGPFRAEAVDRPAGEGDDQRQREQVAGADPADGADGGVELGGQARQRHRDDRDVQHRRDGTEHDDEADFEQFAVQGVIHGG